MYAVDPTRPGEKDFRQVSKHHQLQGRESESWYVFGRAYSEYVVEMRLQGVGTVGTLTLAFQFGDPLFFSSGFIT